MANWKNQNFFKAMKNSINGILYTLKKERNIKIQIIISILVIIFGFLFKLNLTEWLILTITIFIVIIAELVNTAVEVTVDLITEEYNEKAKIAKDISAGAVLMSAINSIIVGIIIFCPKLIFYIR